MSLPSHFRSLLLFVVAILSMIRIGIGADPGSSAVSMPQVAYEYVQAALEAEGRGDFTQRELMLASAAACDQNCPDLMWHKGHVKSPDGSWLSLEECVVNGSQDQNRLKVYAELRDRMRDDVASNLSMATWSIRQGLFPQARAHFERVIDFESDHVAARRALGYQLVQGEWIDPYQIDQLIQQGMAARSSFDLFGKELMTIRRGLESNDAERRRDSESRLFDIHDPQSIPAVLSVFSSANTRISMLLVRWLVQRDNLQSSVTLTRYACLHPEKSVREAATTGLKSRPLHDFVPALLAYVSSPISMTAVPVFADGALVGYRQAFSRQAQDKSDLFVIDTAVQRQAVPLLLNTPSGPDAAGTWITVPPDEMPENRQVERRIREYADLETRVRQSTMNQQNRRIAHQNSRASEVLSAIADKEFSGDANEMWQWWDQTNETEYQLYKPTRNRRVSVRHQIPLYVGVAYAEGGGASGNFSMPSGPNFRAGGLGIGATTRGLVGECFAEGTQVLTAQGPRAIETIRVGDIVFARHIETGALVLRPVLQSTQRPARPTTVIRAGDDELRCTKGHLFWVSGAGWTKASKIKKGDVLHGADEPAVVTSVRNSAPAVTYNLEVADCGTYFVGSKKILSHDVTPRTPTSQTVPGLQLARHAK